MEMFVSPRSGLGMVLEPNDDDSDFIGTNSYLVNGVLISPGDFTDLFGMFKEPVQYSGNLLSKKNCMVFYLGDDTDLFAAKRYYSCFYYINEKRIANVYKRGTARDFNWINGKWK